MRLGNECSRAPLACDRDLAIETRYRLSCEPRTIHSSASDPKDLNVAALNPSDGADQTKERRLAATVRTEQRENLAGGNLKAKRIQRLVLAVPMCDLIDPKRGQFIC